MKNIAY